MTKHSLFAGWFLFLFQQQVYAVELYTYQACQYSEPISVKISADYPGFKDQKVQLNSQSTYSVTLQGDVPQSRETPYVLVKDASGSQQPIRTYWLDRESKKALNSGACQMTEQANRAFQNVMNARDEKFAMDGANRYLNDCIPKGVTSGIYKICVPLVSIDYDKTRSGFSTLKCLLSKANGLADGKATAVQGPPTNIELVQVRVMAGPTYDPAAPVYERTYATESSKLPHDLSKKAFACQNMNVTDQRRINLTPTAVH